MSAKIYRFLWERYRAVGIPLANVNDLPGMLLEARWEATSIFDLFDLFGTYKPNPERDDGFAWDLLGLPADRFKSSIVEANIIQESINEKLSLGGSLALPQYGLDISASFDAATSILVRITGIHARVFDRSAAPFELMNHLLAVKARDTRLWSWVNDDLLITEAYFVSSFSAEFKTDVGVSAKAKFEQSGSKIEAGLEFKWHSDSVLELIGSPSVPLAVRGLKV